MRVGATRRRRTEGTLREWRSDQARGYSACTHLRKRSLRLRQSTSKHKGSLKFTLLCELLRREKPAQWSHNTTPLHPPLAPQLCCRWRTDRKHGARFTHNYLLGGVCVVSIDKDHESSFCIVVRCCTVCRQKTHDRVYGEVQKP